MGASTVLVAIYIDDILVTVNNDDEIKSLKDILHNTFRIKDLGFPNHFLGIEVLHHSKGLILSQRKFIHDLLQEFDTSNLVITHTPLLANLQLKSEDGELLLDPLLDPQFILLKTMLFMNELNI